MCTEEQEHWITFNVNKLCNHTLSALKQLELACLLNSKVTCGAWDATFNHLVHSPSRLEVLYSVLYWPSSSPLTYQNHYHVTDVTLPFLSTVLSASEDNVSRFSWALHGCVKQTVCKLRGRRKLLSHFCKFVFYLFNRCLRNSFVAFMATHSRGRRLTGICHVYFGCVIGC